MNKIKIDAFQTLGSQDILTNVYIFIYLLVVWFLG